MAPAFTIRDYAEADEPQLIALVQEFQAHLNQYFDRNKPPEDMGAWYITHIRDEAARHGGKVLVAEAGGELIGYASLLLQVTSADVVDEQLYSYAYVGDLAVTRSWGRRGVGAALLARCEGLARQAGQKWLRLHVEAGNRLARDFYETAGYAETLILLEKPLS